MKQPASVERVLLMLALFAVLVVLLPGCALFKSAPIEYVPYETKVPIPVPCVAAIPPEPDWAAKNMPHVDPKTGEGIDVATDKLTAERKQRIAYEKKLIAATDGCR